MRLTPQQSMQLVLKKLHDASMDVREAQRHATRARLDAIQRSAQESTAACAGVEDDLEELEAKLQELTAALKASIARGMFLVPKDK